MIDYYIVCTLQPDDTIEYVGTREDLDGTNAEKKLTRSLVIIDIEQGKILYTGYKKNGQLIRGNRVQVYTVEGKKYIKTEKNNLKEDNLDQLRNCSFK